MKKVVLADIFKLAEAARPKLRQGAKSAGREVMLYLHWSAGHYDQLFPEYHINIDGEGTVYTSTDDFSQVKSHTWCRNSGAIGISLACCYGGTTEDLGQEPPTFIQIEAMAQVIAVLAAALELPLERSRIMTHAECADEDGYGPATTCERWDLWFLKNGDTPGTGGDILRGKAIWYQQQGLLR